MIYTMSTTEHRRGKITPEHVEEARRLKAIWDRTRFDREREGVGTQAAFGERFDIGNQAAVGFFLNARTALSMKAAVGFAKGLGCRVADFSPRLADEIEQMMSGSRPPPASTLHAAEKSASWRRPTQSVDDAVDTLSDALELAPDTLREALAANLAGWARSGGTEPWRGVVKGLLAAGGAATPSPAPRVGKRPLTPGTHLAGRVLHVDFRQRLPQKVENPHPGDAEVQSIDGSWVLSPKSGQQ